MGESTRLPVPTAAGASGLALEGELLVAPGPAGAQAGRPGGPGAVIRLGIMVADAAADAAPQIFCDAAALRPHLHRPWFRGYAAQRLGTGLAARQPGDRADLAAVPDAALARHALLCGSTGSGKTRLLLHLLTEQLQAGASAVVLDPKGETVDRLLEHAAAQGWAPETVTVLDPRQEDGVPGWNPLATGIPLSQAVGDLVALLQQSATSWGPRLQDLLTNALLLVGSHPQLSLYEMTRFLIREEYRERLLMAPVTPPDRLAYAEAKSYFRDEFGAWSRTERTGAVSPVLNKIREMLRSPFLRSLLCARRNTLDLGRLWQKPGLLLVRLDRTALGDEGARILAGLLTHALFRTALRQPGPVPVALVIDELPVLERFVGAAIADIVTVARSQNLRLLVACQHLAQLSESLRAALLSNAAVQAFFRLGYADAKVVAASLAAGAPTGISRLVATVDREDRLTGKPELAEAWHPIHDASGHPLRIPPAIWKQFRWNDLFSGQPFGELKRLAAAAGLARLYVRALDTGEPVELRQYVAGLAPGSYRIEGPSLQLVIAFPRPRFTAVERESETDAARGWVARLQELPVQQAVLRVANGGVGVMRVVDVPSPTANRQRRAAFSERSMEANGQSREEVEAALAWREQGVERVAGETRSAAATREPERRSPVPRARRAPAAPEWEETVAAPSPPVPETKREPPATASPPVTYHEEEDDGSID